METQLTLEQAKEILKLSYQEMTAEQRKLVAIALKIVVAAALKPT